MLSTQRLRILREVAYRGSFSAAAQALSYTQSAVSQQVAALEAETGMTLLEDPMYLALPREHPLAAKQRVRLHDLARDAWIQTTSASPCARHVVRCCHAAGFEPRVSFESDDYQTVQGLVAAGVGVALIPELALPVVREDTVVRALAPHPPVRRVTAAVPAGARLVPGAPAMLGVLEEAARQYRRSRGHPAG